MTKKTKKNKSKNKKNKKQQKKLHHYRFSNCQYWVLIIFPFQLLIKDISKDMWKLILAVPRTINFQEIKHLIDLRITRVFW